ncbi:prephenate dehydratase [Halothiobacillus sp. DCM-1]|uniref:prephenate dehydratase n=1 Tax=Halothiobacillus sp. DCM-1 TaxID=3112558 RepID=UPI0032510F13
MATPPTVGRSSESAWSDSTTAGLTTLAEVRACIDSLDAELIRLISRRARLAERVAEIKSADAATQGSFYRPEREAQVLARVRAQNPGPLPSDTLVWLFREIMSACLALEKPLTVACLGPVGTFSEQAALMAFGHGAVRQFEPGIPEVFRAVAAGAVDFGVVPVENSTEGSVTQTLDALAFGGWASVQICGELTLKIEHQLLAHPSAQAAMPREIVSHAQSLAQCREWLDVHYPGVARRAVASNSEAARLASQNPDMYAIAPLRAAEPYGLAVMSANIQDSVFNTTRFVVIGREAVPPSGRDKTSLMLSVNNEPGALARLLAPLADAGIDVTRVESRPARDRAWEYVFFIDCEGHVSEPKLSSAIAAMQPFCSALRVLGAYPRAVFSPELPGAGA